MPWGEEPYIVKEAIPFIAVFASLALLAAASRFGSLFWVLLLATLCVTAFFRNPHRGIPEDPKAIVCPADGKILDVESIPSAGLIPVPSQKISIFMSPLDVHVNRVPASGTVKRKAHMPGKFHVASRAEASSENERMELMIMPRFPNATMGYGFMEIGGYHMNDGNYRPFSRAAQSCPAKSIRSWQKV